MESATAKDILFLLRERPAALVEALGGGDLEMSLPTDGAGARLQVAVREPGAGSLPKVLELEVGGRTIRISVEPVDFQNYQAL